MVVADRNLLRASKPGRDQELTIYLFLKGKLVRKIGDLHLKLSI